MSPPRDPYYYHFDVSSNFYQCATYKHMYTYFHLEIWNTVYEIYFLFSYTDHSQIFCFQDTFIPLKITKMHEECYVVYIYLNLSLKIKIKKFLKLYVLIHLKITHYMLTKITLWKHVYIYTYKIHN